MDATENIIPKNSGLKPALEPIAMVSLDAGRMLMESGATARSVKTIVEMFALGLGSERVDLRIGYASLAITVGVGESGITRMRQVGPLGVNQRLDQELWKLARRVSQGTLDTTETRAELTRLSTKTPRHSALVISVSVGLACAAFGRLLKVDWAGVGPVFLASTIGQYVRIALIRRRVNHFICASVVAFLSSFLGGLGARWAHSQTITTAMIAAILLLVPGVPAMNSQNDILEGHPTLGSARAVTVAMTLIFVATGLWIGEFLLLHWP